MDFMSGNWAWEQVDLIVKDLVMHGSMFVPVILRSDKTTVSVATGTNEYYPLYISIRNIQNHVWRAHRNAVSLVGFLAIPKTNRQHEDSLEFCKCRQQLFHSSLSHILQSLKPWMTKPWIMQCGDGHFRHQVLLACVVSGRCLKCMARPSNFDDDSTAIPWSHHHTSMLENTFQNESTVLWDGYGIVTYVTQFMTQFPRAKIHELLSLDLLHQVIKGTFKDHLIDWVAEYLNLVHGKTHAKEILADIDWWAVTHFHEEHKIFKDSRVCDDFSLGSLNGVCSSITESKHKESVKGPFCCSSHNDPIGEMLLTNQHLGKLAAACVDFAARGMLKGPLQTSGVAVGPQTDDPPDLGDNTAGDNDVEAAARGYPNTIDRLAGHLDQLQLLEYIHCFLYVQFHPNAEVCRMDAPLHSCPIVAGTVHTKVYHSATSTYYAPSDLSGISGMHWEIIRATLSWKKGPGRYDCVYIETDSDLDGFQGLLWFTTYGNSPCEEMGLWRVEPDIDVRGHHTCSVVHIDTILWSAHLIGVAGSHLLPRTFTYHDSLYAFHLFYVNKYADHHAHEITY
ncbi:hypothetical protein EI94DRAFT_1771804 [Lactarius quietus]|nr:hypothetical protein EI94DRAFT_1771804 [Lactarius quietus]